jgi:hypothetical protein
LPVLALILSFGAFRHSTSPGTTTSQNPKLIPIISSLSGGSNAGTSTANDSSPGSSGLSTGGPSAGASTSSLSGATGGGTASSGSTTPIVGGRGGGPTGGTSGTGGTTVTTSVIGIGTTCTTTTCTVTGCSQPETISDGQKVLAGLGGTCTVIDP